MPAKGNQKSLAVTSSPKQVLVVGDWVVDDYWVTGDHRSPSASRVGRAHLRALNDAGSSVQALVGAGRVASLLHSARSGGREVYSVVGLGIWHKQDTEQLVAMFERKSFQG